ncbi:MAG TPA: hypothetical protein VGX68_25920 [Thermoanaerobaculia bacterium]|jgi:hypothetical protein|nr:hypothetical protein [Thermoanaerobaculia bacterium]
MARNPFLCSFAICLLALFGAQPLPAQLEPAPEAGGGGTATGAQASPGGQPPETPLARVVGATSTDHRNRAGLGDGLTVRVENLKPALAKVENGCEGLILFLNEIPIKGVPPESCSLATGDVRFTLDRTDDSDRAWHALLEEPIAFQKTVSVSVGPEGDLSFPSTAKFQLIVLPEVQFYGYFVGLLLFFLLLVRLSRRTSLLRDATAAPPAGKLAPYSLSLFQLAFWSFLVVAAYVFIWLITEELDTITGSVLALLGIGSSTALAANLIDSGKAAAADGEREGVVSRGFLRDVLSDEQGISLYRFQLFIWTLVLGVIFIASVYNGLQMPQFNPTLLGLMGISSGTYLGFKVPESRTPEK